VENNEPILILNRPENGFYYFIEVGPVKLNKASSFVSFMIAKMLLFDVRKLELKIQPNIQKSKVFNMIEYLDRFDSKPKSLIKGDAKSKIDPTLKSVLKESSKKLLDEDELRADLAEFDSGKKPLIKR